MGRLRRIAPNALRPGVAEKRVTLLVLHVPRPVRVRAALPLNTISSKSLVSPDTPSRFHSVDSAPGVRWLIQPAARRVFAVKPGPAGTLSH